MPRECFRGTIPASGKPGSNHHSNADCGVGNVRRRRSKVDTWREGIGFWLIVLLVCIVAGVISYQAGRNWVGRQLARIDLQARRPELPAGGEDAAALPDLDEPEASEPPLTAQVTIEERAPSQAEKAEVQRASLEREVRDGPQDGAQLNAERAAARAARAATANSSSRYVVTAGSYADSDNAQEIIEQLTGKGYRPFRAEVEKSGVVYWRVNVAVFEDRAQAEQLRDELKRQGFVSGVMTE